MGIYANRSIGVLLLPLFCFWGRPVAAEPQRGETATQTAAPNADTADKNRKPPPIPNALAVEKVILLPQIQPGIRIGILESPIVPEVPPGVLLRDTTDPQLATESSVTDAAVLGEIKK